MGRQLGIGPVDLRIVEIGLVDPGLQVVRHEPRGDAAEERDTINAQDRAPYTATKDSIWPTDSRARPAWRDLGKA